MKEQEIHTKIVDGNPSSFKAALSRSILGVTWYKFKRRKQVFYQNRPHNLAITEGIYNWLYERLLSSLENLSRYNLKTDLKPQWDENSKIRAVSNIKVSVYMKIGELNVEKLRVSEQSSVVKIDFFFSKFDLRSQKLMSKLPQISGSMEEVRIDLKKHDFSTDEGRRIAEAYSVKGTPTVVINAERTLEDPSEKKLIQEIENALTPVVVSEGEVHFTFEQEAKSSIESLNSLMETR